MDYQDTNHCLQAYRLLMSVMLRFKCLTVRIEKYNRKYEV